VRFAVPPTDASMSAEDRGTRIPTGVGGFLHGRGLTE
jgi:hypothetical protein